MAKYILLTTAVDAISAETMEQFSTKKYRNLEDAEAAMCLLAREVASKDPSILLNLLVNHKSFRKTWKRHQKYDREQGRSYYVFDKKNKQLVFFPAETTSDKE